MLYDNFSQFIVSLLIWWVILLVFQRLSNRYPVRNTWKRDVFLTLIQSVVILLVLLPILSYFF